MNPLEFNFWRDPSYRFHNTLMVDMLVPMRVRKWVARIALLIVIFHLIVSVGPFLLGQLSSHSHTITPLGSDALLNVAKDSLGMVPDEVTFPRLGGVVVPLSPETPRGNALFLFALAIWFVFSAISWFRNSYYFYVEGLLERGESGSQTAYTTQNYEVCAVYWNTTYGDLTRSYAQSVYGRMILRRAGVSDETMDEYLKKRTHIVDFNQHIHEMQTVFTLNKLSQYILNTDADLYQFLFGLGVRERELVGAAEWVERDLKRQKQKSRWWGKVNLGRTTGFGAELAYGDAYVLGRYSVDLTKKAMSGGSNFRFVYGNEQIAQLEVVLSRSKEANAILVGEEGSGKMDVILDFARDIMNGFTNPQLKHKRVMSLNTKLLISNMKSKQELETELLRILGDAIYAGNIILVIEDLPGFIAGAQALDADVIGLLDPYLSGTALQVIATADNARFHQMIEPNQVIMQRFEKVTLTEPEEDSLVRIVEESAEKLERRHQIYFTYPAIIELIRSAKNFFSNGVMPDKAIDLLVEITPWMLARGGHLVKKLDILAFIREKTNIPVGEIKEDERDKLQNLEVLLKQHVIGQEMAIEVVANAMRRSRAGVRNTERPIGAFLFLGPTGVGKTETAKALSKVFFDSETALSRIDMSEYQGDDGLSRMIGTMEGETGTLPVLLKEQQYGVVLLDEFEKTNPKVLDLFLQIFDEGIFHDAMGGKVNARNSIFIATSNAGSQMIRDAIREGKILENVKDQIVNEIISQGRLKPELINRFDAVVLFHPLTMGNYREVAKMMLQKLQKRLRDKSINLVINELLIDAVLQHGVNADFGARPMTRAIQEVVEQKIAAKIIAGQVSEGATLEFTRADFPELG